MRVFDDGFGFASHPAPWAHSCMGFMTLGHSVLRQISKIAISDCGLIVVGRERLPVESTVSVSKWVQETMIILQLSGKLSEWRTDAH